MDWFHADTTLQTTLARDLSGAFAEVAPHLLGALAQAGRQRIAPLSWLADRHPPQLRTHDPFGERIDEVVYHPSQRELARLCFCDLGLLAMKYEGFGGVAPALAGDSPDLQAELAEEGAAPQLLSFAAAYVLAQADAGQCAALALADATARVISRYGDDALRRDLLPLLCARGEATRVGGGLFLTERGAGSDLGQVQTQAVRDGSGYRLSGDKWFCAGVDAGVILALARVVGPGVSEDSTGTRGLGLFALTPHLPDGRRNGIVIHRLKETLGLRGLPIGEVSLSGAWARAVGPVGGLPGGHSPASSSGVTGSSPGSPALGQGFKPVTEILNLSRIYSSVIAVGLLRRALFESLGWLSARTVFRRRAVDQPLAIETVADLAAECSGAFLLTFDLVGRLSQADSGAATVTDRRVLRLLTPLTKAYTARLAVWGTSQSLELHGGNGYVEEFAAPRLLRDAQALPLFAGTSNICVLDGLRALQRAGVAEALFREAERKLVAITHPKLRKLAEATRRHLDRVERSLQRLWGFSQEVLQHHARAVLDALVQSYQVALALSESDRLDEHGQGGRDYLVAERLLTRHLERPSLETVGPWHIDPLRLQVLLGERPARVAEVA